MCFCMDKELWLVPYFSSWTTWNTLFWPKAVRFTYVYSVVMPNLICCITIWECSIFCDQCKSSLLLDQIKWIEFSWYTELLTQTVWVADLSIHHFKQCLEFSFCVSSTSHTKPSVSTPFLPFSQFSSLSLVFFLGQQIQMSWNDYWTQV